MLSHSSLLSHIDSQKSRFLEKLFEILRIPTISAQSAHRDDMLQCAEKIVSLLRQAGLKNAQVMPTDGQPCVFASYEVDESLPTVLVYGHYDVQPPDPLDLWQTPPFEPEIRDDKIFARGSADDKGQVMMHIKALEWMIAESFCLPCNVKILIEGEEEIGSPSLASFVEKHKSLLACDIILISDSAMHSLEIPTIDTGMRGLSYLQVEVTGPSRDLHSGVYGGAVPNPITILCEMIASLHDDKQRVNIPHFYDKVFQVSSEERELLSGVPYNTQEFLNETGCKGIRGEAGFETHERTGIRPTLELNGIWGGYTGEGAKTVIPSKAFAKLSCRLVPHQETDEIATLVANHLQSIAPKEVSVKVEKLHGGNAYVIPIEHIGYQAAALAMEKTFGKKPLPKRGGGSIPIVSILEHILGAKTVFLGFGLDDDNLHSPNEKFNVQNFLKGIETIPFFYSHFVDLSVKK